MPVTYQGMDCLKDQGSAAFLAAYQLLQAQVSWSSQTAYGYYTIYFGCAFVGVALFKHLYYSYRDYSYRKTQTSNYLTGFIDVITSYMRYFSYKRLPVAFCNLTSLPSSAGSSIFILGSTLYLGLYVFVPHFWYRGCRGFGSPPLAVRAGIMATALTPFIYLLSGKANFVSFVTGISYEKLNYIHQYVAVMALVLSLVHTIPFFYQDLAEGGQRNLNDSFHNNFDYWSGVAPLVILILLCTLSKSWIRSKFYETFWHSHWVLGAGYFATLMYHCFGQLGTSNYMWAALAFWGFQVLYRILVKTSFKPNALFLRPRKAQIFKLPGTNGFQINVPNNKIKWKPGQHVYLRFTSRILDNHPFSVVNLPNPQDNELKFIVMPKGGLTQKIYQEVENNVSDVTQKKVFLDGPYGGCARDHNSFDKVVLIATGSGVTAILSFMLDLVQKTQSGANTVTKEIDFIWIIRHPKDLEWIQTELKQCAESPLVNINVYIAGKANDISKTKTQTFSESDSAIEIAEKNIEGINIYEMKPLVVSLLAPFRYNLKRRNMFVSSGSNSLKLTVSDVISSFQPQIFNNDINASAVEEVFLHTESFNW